MGYGLEKGDVQGDDEGLNNMRHLGQTIDLAGELSTLACPHIRTLHAVVLNE